MASWSRWIDGRARCCQAPLDAPGGMRQRILATTNSPARLTSASIFASLTRSMRSAGRSELPAGAAVDGHVAQGVGIAKAASACSSAASNGPASAAPAPRGVTFDISARCGQTRHDATRLPPRGRRADAARQNLPLRSGIRNSSHCASMHIARPGLVAGCACFCCGRKRCRRKARCASGPAPTEKSRRSRRDRQPQSPEAQIAGVRVKLGKAARTARAARYETRAGREPVASAQRIVAIEEAAGNRLIGDAEYKRPTASARDRFALRRNSARPSPARSRRPFPSWNSVRPTAGCRLLRAAATPASAPPCARRLRRRRRQRLRGLEVIDPARHLIETGQRQIDDFAADAKRPCAPRSTDLPPHAASASSPEARRRRRSP